jgi:spore coat protein U-like protein
MKREIFLTRIARGISLLSLVFFICFASAQAQTTAFTYQGKLTDGATAANGIYDLGFALFDADAGGNQIGSTITRASVTVSNGIFTVQLDFGANPFTSGANRYLEIVVKRPADANFTTLTPRPQLKAMRRVKSAQMKVDGTNNRLYICAMTGWKSAILQ